MFHSISLAMLQRDGVPLEELISYHGRKAPLTDEDDHCERCKEHQCRSCALSVVRWPQVLVLHLKRWEVELFPVYKATKRDEHVSFETILQPTLGEAGAPYYLRGVVIHLGGVGAGHYIAYVCARDNQWYYCDDQSLDPPHVVAVQEVLRSRAYMLVYEKS